MNRTSLLVVAFLSLGAGAGTSQTVEGLSERIYQEACDDGDMTACNMFGLMNETGQGIAQNLPRAIELYQRACEGGMLVGCTNLGLMYEAGVGVTQDVVRAVGLYQVACEGGEQLGCRSAQEADPTRGVWLGNRFYKSGRVGNTETGEALSGVIISVPDLGIQTITDLEGRFQVSGALPNGRYRLKAEHVGYEVLEGEMVVPGRTEFLVLLTPTELGDPNAPGGITGRVTDEGGERGLVAVDVTVLGEAQARAITNQQGRFVLEDLPPGLAEVRFTRLGYAPRTATLIVHPGRTMELSATMFTAPIEIDPISVTVRSRLLEQNGFYRRMESASSGTQFTREEIEAVEPLLASDVLRRVPGFGLEFDQANPDIVWAVSRRTTSISLGPCQLPVFIDGIQLFEPDINQIPPEQIEAMEIFHGVSTPVQFRDGRNACGAVLIWTKRTN